MTIVPVPGVYGVIAAAEEGPRVRVAPARVAGRTARVIPGWMRRAPVTGRVKQDWLQ